jgi:hypothetical protein
MSVNVRFCAPSQTGAVAVRRDRKSRRFDIVRETNVMGQEEGRAWPYPSLPAIVFVALRTTW